MLMTKNLLECGAKYKVVCLQAVDIKLSNGATLAICRGDYGTNLPTELIEQAWLVSMGSNIWHVAGVVFIMMAIETPTSKRIMSYTESSFPSDVSYRFRTKSKPSSCP